MAGPEGLPRPPRAPGRPLEARSPQGRLGQTTAWGSGGYYGRLFLNVRGREPQGLIAPEDYEATRDKLIAELEALGDPDGRPIGTRVLKPESRSVPVQVRGLAPPDLFVYFGNLRWRSVGTVGTGQIHTFENDTGPDDANHAQDGDDHRSPAPAVAPRGPVAKAWRSAT